MRILIIITVLLSCGITYAQKKKPSKTKVPPPIVQPGPKLSFPPPITKVPEVKKENCFININEEPKDSLVNQTKTIVEYGWAADNARIIIESKEYDPIKDQEAKAKGYTLIWREFVQYINGKFKIEKDIMTFIPDKLDKFEKQNFKLVYKAKIKEVDYLQDSENNKYTIGECPLPVVSM